MSFPIVPRIRAQIPMAIPHVQQPAKPAWAAKLAEDDVNARINQRLQHGKGRPAEEFKPASAALALAKARRK